MTVQAIVWTSPDASEAKEVSQSGASGSDTTTLARAVSPSLVTVMVNVALSPDNSVCRSGVFDTEIAGSMTSTTAVSTSPVGLPSGSSPVTTAVFVKSAATEVASHE